MSKIKALDEMFENYKYIEGTKDDKLIGVYLGRIKVRIDNYEKKGNDVVWYKNQYFKLDMRR